MRDDGGSVSVYLLWHSRPLRSGGTDDKLLGVYSTLEQATGRQKESARLPGFRDVPAGFSIDERTLDEDDWTAGYRA